MSQVIEAERINKENQNIDLNGPDIKRFKSFLNVVIFTVFALIFVGGAVRSTGAGMGCPDWPTCFGKIVPPTSIDQLPADYQQRFAKAGKRVAEFNPIHTWTEYMNRMAGVWTGIASIILVVLASRLKKYDPYFFKWSSISLALVIINGGVGAMVVKTHLLPFVITVHMLLAIFLVFALANIKNRLILNRVELSKDVSQIALENEREWLWILVGLVILQVILGTQVREQIDIMTNGGDFNREGWLGKLDYIFYIHRTFSIVLLLGFYITLKKIFKKFSNINLIQHKCISILLIIVGTVVLGAILAYFSFPKWAQPLHLLFAIGLCYYIYELILLLNMTKDVGSGSIGSANMLNENQ